MPVLPQNRILCCFSHKRCQVSSSRHPRNSNAFLTSRTSPVCSKHRRHIKAAGRRLPVSVRRAVILRRSADAALLRPVHRSSGSPVCPSLRYFTSTNTRYLPSRAMMSISCRHLKLYPISSYPCSFRYSPPVSHTLFPSAACSSGILSPAFRPIHHHVPPSGFFPCLLLPSRHLSSAYSKPDSLSFPFMRSISSTKTRISATTS